MESNLGVAILEKTKVRCLSAKEIKELYILIDAVKSVLLKCNYTDSHPFYLRLTKVEAYFNKHDESLYGIGILPAQKMINDIIDSIIIELEFN